MAVTPTLDTLEALYRKLEREQYRAYHHPQPIHKADHFYNFCITAHALRDYFFERTGLITDAQKMPLNNQWSKEELLVAVADIANSAKHFALRRSGRVRAPRLRGVRARRNTFVNVYQDRDGHLYERSASGPDLVITLRNGTKHELYDFMGRVTVYWRDFLRANGIRLRRQPLARLGA